MGQAECLTLSQGTGIDQPLPVAVAVAVPRVVLALPLSTPRAG